MNRLVDILIGAFLATSVLGLTAGRYVWRDPSAEARRSASPVDRWESLDVMTRSALLRDVALIKRVVPGATKEAILENLTAIHREARKPLDAVDWSVLGF